MNYIKYDFINNEISDTYETIEDVIKCADEFYHDTFKYEEDYDETKDISEINEALELLEGSGYLIYVELKKILNNNNEE